MNELDKNIKRNYSILKYDPSWVAEFEIINKFVSEVFGDKALDIEHVGSTSITGIAAKPIIDVLVIVENVKDLSYEIQKMVDSGYVWGENYIAPDTHVFFKTGPGGEKLDNIHVCGVGSPKVRQLLSMRDYLRSFPEKAKQYAELKELNFKKYPNDYPAYRDAKASFLKQIEKEAYEWEESKKTL